MLPHDLSLLPRRKTELMQHVENHDRGRNLNDSGPRTRRPATLVSMMTSQVPRDRSRIGYLVVP